MISFNEHWESIDELMSFLGSKDDCKEIFLQLRVISLSWRQSAREVCNWMSTFFELMGKNSTNILLRAVAGKYDWSCGVIGT